MNFHWECIIFTDKISVADPGCLSRISDPDFYPSRISDSGSRIPDPGSRIPYPGSNNSSKREEWKKNCCHTFFWSHKFHINEHYFIFEMPKKNIWANFQRIIEFFTQKIVTKLSKIWVWDPRSGIRKKPIPDPGSTGQKAPDPRSRIRIRNAG